MNLREIIEKVKSKRTQTYSEDKLLSEFNISGWIEGEPVRITEAYYKKWYCTDTWVGGKVYFLDDKAVAVSYQEGRKYPENFQWLSKELAHETRDYLISLLETEDDYFDIISDEELDEPMGKGYRICYGSSLLTNTLYTIENDQKCEVTKVYRSYKDIDKWRTVEVKFEDGTKKEMNILDLYIPFGE